MQRGLQSGLQWGCADGIARCTGVKLGTKLSAMAREQAELAVVALSPSWFWTLLSPPTDQRQCLGDCMHHHERQLPASASFH